MIEQVDRKTVKIYDLNKTINQLDLMDTYETLYLIIVSYFQVHKNI